MYVCMYVCMYYTHVKVNSSYVCLFSGCPSDYLPIYLFLFEWFFFVCVCESWHRVRKSWLTPCEKGALYGRSFSSFGFEAKQQSAK